MQISKAEVRINSYPLEMKKAGRPTQGKTVKVRSTITVDPALVAAVKKAVGPRLNWSGWMEDAGWEKLNRAMRLGPNLGPNRSKMGKK